ncbi:hypothetical protein EXIGLDRAFT_714522 [Exidia glandulosa HHB12029]|uniref:Uncharacterized protein n=1 Tax=Exidia glandulosa HHB12029 TaxID=1314781 RepID=A0A165BBC3_EXIGL|nr:hypothetical protein EXIGLDRAFT_714522 [Exidia glandulosa HHB12029]
MPPPASSLLFVPLLRRATTVQVIDNTPDLLGVPTPLLIDATGNVQEDATNYTFVAEDFPVIAWRQIFGSAAIKLDLVAADAKITTNLRKRGKIVDLFSWWWPGIFKPAGTFSKVKTVGPLFEYDYLPRNDEVDNPYYETAVPGVFANGTTIPVGQYKTLLRVLKVGGNPAKEEDYEAWLSPVVGVVAA